MGAETSSLEECSLEPPVIPGSETEWEVRHGITFENDTPITVFSERSKKKDNLRVFERNIKFLKSVRHPNILHYIRDGKNEDRFLVTERATPLSLVLGDLSSMEVASGICNIISALSFLHDKANICHNNICADAVYVTENGHWKLGGFECSCRFIEASPEFLKSVEKFRNENSIVPEERGGSLNLTTEFGHVRDVYSFGVLVDSLLEQLEDLDEIIKTFELRIQDECLNSDPKQRPKLHTFLEDKIFSNDLLSLSTFLHHITLKNKDEREEFYRNLLQRLQSLPEETVGKHLVKPLLCRFVLLDKTAREVVAPHILTPIRDLSNGRFAQRREITPVFSESIYRSYVIPELYKAFCCHEINIRTLLLKFFPCYVDLFDKEKLEDIIFPQILLGIRDTNEELAALSLHCLADMISILGRDVVIGGRSKTYFIEGLPKNVNANLQEKDPAKNINGVIGKVKLKDLATLSKTKTESNQSSPSDSKSKEEKMKEARERREQKRLERQNKKNSLTKATADERNKIDTIVKSEPVDQEINMELNLIDSVQPEVFSTDKDDWSDWEDENQSLNDDWSNSSHDRVPSPSNSSVTKETTQSLSSNKHHSPNRFHPTDTRTDSMGSTDNDINDNTSKPSSKSNRTFKKSGMSLKGKVKTIKPQANKPLGAEFDIHNVEIKVQAQKEEDFFADMIPEIKPTTPKENLSLSLPKSPVSSSKTEKSSMFVYTEAEVDKDTSASGWGDDDGWDVEGF
ncbi:protein-associating with the carboxyl-terminal domain of ezrin-like [Mytilus californianus]|uniref:protein-associating with the carboxyl-terminal domain of ezrin-like n=1 Tax=Mytilus californianus TaxID=6549 RepID=UPI0022458576|nr:protein-associating with the carboxyl-terminal domain of ezrin-like [Mytilus californianus]